MIARIAGISRSVVAGLGNQTGKKRDKSPRGNDRQVTVDSRRDKTDSANNLSRLTELEPVDEGGWEVG
jgi:hypothetical protein